LSDFELSQDSSDSQNGSAATMEEFLNQEEASSKRLAHGDIIDGVVVRVDPDDHTQLRVTLLPLPPGQYRVIWRVVSIDTHFRSGSFPFRVDP